MTIPKPKVGDLIKVETKNGNKLCKIDEEFETKIHFANNSKSAPFGLLVNKDRIRYKATSWRGANFVYVSFN